MHGFIAFTLRVLECSDDIVIAVVVVVVLAAVVSRWIDAMDVGADRCAACRPPRSPIATPCHCVSVG